MKKGQQEQEQQEAGAVDNLAAIESELTAEQAAAEQEDKALADEVQAEAGQSAEREQIEQARRQGAEQGAAFAVAMMESLIKGNLPFVEIEPEAKAQVQQKMVPVLMKHGGGMPEWLQPYREEIELGFVLATTGFGVAMQVRAHRIQEQQTQETPGQQTAAADDAEPKAKPGGQVVSFAGIPAEGAL